MKKSTYMDRALKAADPRFAQILSKLGYQRRDMVPAAQVAQPAPVQQQDPLAELRDAYFAAVGKRPFHGWDADQLREKIAAANAGQGGA